MNALPKAQPVVTTMDVASRRKKMTGWQMVIKHPMIKNSIAISSGVLESSPDNEFREKNTLTKTTYGISVKYISVHTKFAVSLIIVRPIGRYYTKLWAYFR